MAPETAGNQLSSKAQQARDTGPPRGVAEFQVQMVWKAGRDVVSLLVISNLNNQLYDWVTIKGQLITRDTEETSIRL